MTTRVGSNNEWFEATVMSVTEESPTVKTFVFKTPHPITNIAGQHYELRLTAENGYQAARLYSAVVTGTGKEEVTLTIMNVKNGEVSPYISEDLKVGDEVEIRGPFGKFFIWTGEEYRPVFLVGGGSGVVPLHAIFTAHRDSKSKAEMKLLYSSHTYEEILYKDDFLSSPDVAVTLTRNAPEDWEGLTGRVTKDMLGAIVDSFEAQPICYVCGMSLFVDAITEALQVAGIPSTSIKTERFG
ncbi:MAG: flavodoxin reductase family protein [Candidatus Saccharibacteria bacterium]|nr:flavodoxin reductase family protein [Candidatus Saccharibacteria bacterium]